MRLVMAQEQRTKVEKEYMHGSIITTTMWQLA